MIYRLILSFILILAFTIENHIIPGGKKFDPDAASFMLFFLSIAFTWSWIVFWDTRSNPKWGKFLVPFFMGATALLHYYEIRSGSPLDVSVIFDNWRSVQNTTGLGIVFGLLVDRFVAADVFWTLVVLFGFYLTYKEKKSRLLAGLRNFPVVTTAVPWVLLIVISFFFNFSFEAFAGIFRGSLARVYSMPFPLKVLALEKKPAPPWAVIENADAKNESHPNIILVFIESLSSAVVETRSPAGLEYMPKLNALIKKGLYFEKQYSVSVQTARGQFAALCGKIPIFQGVEAQNHEKKEFDCLPEYMNKLGYSTVFIQAFGKPDFDNKTRFYLEQGFQDVPQVAQTCEKEKNVPCWNWGIQDDEFYRRSLKKIKEYPEPFLLSLTTVSSHMPFKGTPEKLIVHYPNPRNRFENYVNTVTVADSALDVLLEEIDKAGIRDNTVVMIMGDHGFPMGQHQNFHNENYAFEENFRVPLLILDLRPGSKMRGRVSHPTSHLNLAATVLDIANYKGPTRFHGESLLEPGFEDQPIYLVQPYSGILLGSIRWPWKFLFEMRTKKEWVFNLEKDPHETTDLDQDKVPPEVWSQLQEDVAAIIWNNIQVNRK